MSLNVCVFCASSNHAPRKYFEIARDLGEKLAARGWPLVYGGGSVGLMGEIARTVRASGGRIIGVIPEKLRVAEVAYEDCDDLVVTKDMADRKTVMIDRSDVFLCLPGAFGTLDELFEVLTLKILGYHEKAIVLVDTDGFYQPLVDYFDRFFEDRLANPAYRSSYHIEPDVDSALSYLESRTPWTRPDRWN